MIRHRGAPAPLVALLVLAVLPACAPAHTSSPAMSAPPRAHMPPSILTPLAEGEEIRVDANGTRRSGLLVSWDSTHLVLFSDGRPPASVPLPDVTGLWTHADHGRRGAWIGAALGAVPVALVCGETVDECGLLPNGVLLVLTTSAVGWIIGHELDAWHEVWPGSR